MDNECNSLICRHKLKKPKQNNDKLVVRYEVGPSNCTKF